MKFRHQILTLGRHVLMQILRKAAGRVPWDDAEGLIFGADDLIFDQNLTIFDQ